MEQVFLQTLQQKQLLAGGEKILVGLSGGPDSVALLSLLHSVSRRFRLTLVAAHLDHGIRPEAETEAEFARRLCAGWGIPFEMERVDVPQAARERHQGIEETARDMRRSFLLRTASRNDCQLIALGHHLDDQAETFLHRLLRGTGPTGLSAMRPVEGRIIRPLLSFSRSQILDYLLSNKISFVEDISNLDCRFTRNRLRHRLLPLLGQFNPCIEQHFARLAEIFALEEDYWRQETNRLAGKVGERDDEGWNIALDELRKLSLAVQKRLLRRFLEEVRETPRGLTWRQFAQVEGVLSSGNPHAEMNLRDCWIGRDYDQVRILRRRPDFSKPFSVVVKESGTTDIPGVGRIEVLLTLEPRGEDRWSKEFDGGEVAFPLTIRSYMAGDRFQPSGLRGRKKLKELYIDTKVPFSQRNRVPLVIAEEILWVAGFRRSSLFPVTPETATILRLTFIPAPQWPNLPL